MKTIFAQAIHDPFNLCFCRSRGLSGMTGMSGMTFYCLPLQQHT
jgi:hypothetical protein